MICLMDDKTFEGSKPWWHLKNHLLFHFYEAETVQSMSVSAIVSTTLQVSCSSSNLQQKAQDIFFFI